MNSFIREMEKELNYKTTENGAVALKSTLSKVYDMFAFGGAYRQRTDNDIITLFSEAFLEDRNLAMKCLFYLGDARGGQGERRFFRVAFKHFLSTNPPVKLARQLIERIPEYRRWDDVIYSTESGTIYRIIAYETIEKQLRKDVQSENPSICAKWLPSINASNYETRIEGKRLAKFLRVKESEYRKLLAGLRKKIKVLERTMSERKWDDVDFSTVPSQANLKYSNCFRTREEIRERYADFVVNKSAKMKMSVAYPYEIVGKITERDSYTVHTDKVFQESMQKMWDSQKDWTGGKSLNALAIVDTSGSMTWGLGAVRPINVAISLGLYTATRLQGPFKDHFMTFSHRPQLFRVDSTRFAPEVVRIYSQNLCENTDLEAAFRLVLDTAKNSSLKQEQIPEKLIVISDMEIDYGSVVNERRELMVNRMRKEFEEAGYKMPELIWWNVNARNNTILDNDPTATLISGCSPSIFKQVVTGKSGVDLMLEALMSDRYKEIEA